MTPREGLSLVLREKPHVGYPPRGVFLLYGFDIPREFAVRLVRRLETEHRVLH